MFGVWTCGVSVEETHLLGGVGMHSQGIGTVATTLSGHRISSKHAF